MVGVLFHVSINASVYQRKCLRARLCLKNIILRGSVAVLASRRGVSVRVFGISEY